MYISVKIGHNYVCTVAISQNFDEDIDYYSINFSHSIISVLIISFLAKHIHDVEHSIT